MPDEYHRWSSHVFCDGMKRSGDRMQFTFSAAAEESYWASTMIERTYDGADRILYYDLKFDNLNWRARTPYDWDEDEENNYNKYYFNFKLSESVAKEADAKAIWNKIESEKIGKLDTTGKIAIESLASKMALI